MAEKVVIGNAELWHGDCREVLPFLPTHDLLLTDPPYGIADLGGKWGKKAEWHWDKAPADNEAQFLAAGRVQIVWGGNYFKLPPTRGIISWDKVQDMPTLSAWEMAWTSFDCVARIYRGRSQDPNRIHPTQKPVDLYKWVFSKYAKPGQRVLDTHLGSGSIAIAAHYAGVHLTACEIDPDYYEAAKARISRETSQTELFIHHNR